MAAPICGYTNTDVLAYSSDRMKSDETLSLKKTVVICEDHSRTMQSDFREERSVETLKPIQASKARETQAHFLETSFSFRVMQTIHWTLTDCELCCQQFALMTITVIKPFQRCPLNSHEVAASPNFSWNYFFLSFQKSYLMNVILGRTDLQNLLQTE